VLLLTDVLVLVTFMIYSSFTLAEVFQFHYSLIIYHFLFFLF